MAKWDSVSLKSTLDGFPDHAISGVIEKNTDGSVTVQRPDFPDKPLRIPKDHIA